MIEKSCYNCQKELTKEESFCPNCGQKVDDNNLNLRAVSHEFFENYLSLDTRIGRSILPFLFQPGRLVNEFVAGKRVTYVNPFRFYLIISIFFFFILGVFVDKTVTETGAESVEVENKDEEKTESSNLTLNLEEFSALIDSLEKVDSTLVQSKIDSIIKANKLEKMISFSKDSIIKEPKKLVKINSSGLGFNIDVSRLEALKEYRYDKSYTDLDLLDSISTDSLSRFEKHLATQTIKLYRSDTRMITRFAVGNLSLNMLVLIPGLAFFFFIFYYRQRMPFVGHLIHSLNLHTVNLFIYGIAFVLYYFFEVKVFFWIAFLCSAVYWFFSLKKVYPKRSFSTFWRFIGLGILYYFFWVLTIAIGILISFLLF